ILNVTPDSFAESRNKLDPAVAIEAGLRLEADGADIVDVGGESTRPGAAQVSGADEMARIVPVVRGLADRLKVPISVDTYKAAAARAALDAGAAMVNDISGLGFEPGLAVEAAKSGAALVLMHTRGGPSTMHAEAAYTDLKSEIVAELRGSMALALDAG